MEGKNVVYLVALVVTCLFVVLVLAYIPSIKEMLPSSSQSSNIITNIENNIDSEQYNDNLQEKPVLKSILKKQKVQPDAISTENPHAYTIQQHEKPKVVKGNNLQNGELIGDSNLVSQSLLGLVTPRNESVNQSYVDPSKPFMEFDVPYNQSIDGDSINQSANKISYEIDYQFGWHTNNIKLVNNTTEFQPSLAERGNAEITYRYTEDKNQENRNAMLDNRRNNEADRAEIIREFPVESSLEQRVSFFMWDIKFNKALKMPQELIIWNEHSTELYPCYMIEHSFPHDGASYNVDYTCNKLPNFNDYGGKLKFIFN